MSEDHSSQPQEKKETVQVPDADNNNDTKSEKNNSEQLDSPESKFEAADSWSLLTGCFDPNPLNDDETNEDEKQ